MKKTFTFILSLVFSTLLFSQPVADGVINANEYGSHVNGDNQMTTNLLLTTVYMTWDANNLYVGISGGFTNQDALNLYIDLDAALPVNSGGMGSTVGTGFDNQTPTLPFQADLFIFVKNGYNAVRFFDGTTWNDGSDPLLCIVEPIFCGGLDNKLPFGSSATVMEFSVPFAFVTGLGLPAPTTFNFLSYLSFDNVGGCGSFAHLPERNGVHAAAVACPGAPNLYHYQTVTNMYAAPVTFPFSQHSFTQFNTGDFLMNTLEGTSFYDLTVSDGTFANTDNATLDLSLPNRLRVFDDFEIQHDLYIGPSSALYPDDARSPILTLSGADGHFYNRGRLESNPDDTDVNNEKLIFTFNGTTSLMPSTLTKSLFRFSDINIATGGTLKSSTTGIAEVEFQWGTLQNAGTLDFYESPTAYVNVGIRGDIMAIATPQNDYFFSKGIASGQFEFHDLLIGRFSSHLMPAPLGNLMDISIKGNFENYDEFSSQNGVARINIIMNGEKAQFIRGNVDETTGATTTFAGLEIANMAGDVSFESFQNTSPAGTHVDYLITENLTLTSGDLVTRNRVDNSIHQLTIGSTGTTTFAGATNGGAASCFVDGPLSRQVNAAGLTTLDFPVGKTSATTGDYRHLSLNLTYALATPATYTTEMFIQDRSATYGFPAPVLGDVIGTISTVRYWNVTPDNTANLTSATVTSGYHIQDNDDGVTDAATLRLLKDNGTDWENISPGMGGSADFTGTISSLPFTTFSDFTLATLLSLLDVTLVSFSGTPTDHSVLLDWVTSQEKEVSHFSIERKAAGESFYSIGRVSAKGDTQTQQSYSFVDHDYPSFVAEMYYRLKMVDRDGVSTYSQVIAVFPKLETQPSMHLNSQPSSGTLDIHVFGELQKGTRFTLKDIHGRLVAGKSLDRNAEPSFHIGSLATGMYVATLHIHGATYSQKVVIW